jgi:hypothetical protein
MSLADCQAALVAACGDPDAATAILTRHAASVADEAAPNGFWHYQCDFGHEWVVYRPVAAHEDEDPAQVRCPHGHEVVTLRLLRHADRTRVSLLPVARVAATARGEAVVAEDRYRVVIARTDGQDERVSEREYGWEEAVELAERFRRLAFFQSLGVWARLRP